MKSRLLILVALLVAALCGCRGGESDGPENIFIAYEADSGRTVTMSVSDELQIILDENQTTGYLWSVVTNDEDVLGQSGEPSFVIDDDSVGAGGEKTYTFRAIAPGTSALVLVNAMEGQAAVDPDRIFELTVEVVEVVE